MSDKQNGSNMAKTYYYFPIPSQYPNTQSVNFLYTVSQFPNTQSVNFLIHNQSIS